MTIDLFCSPFLLRSGPMGSSDNGSVLFSLLLRPGQQGSSDSRSGPQGNSNSGYFVFSLFQQDWSSG